MNHNQHKGEKKIKITLFGILVLNTIFLGFPLLFKLSLFLQ